MLQYKPVEQLLANLFRQDIRVWIDNGRLRCAGPDQAMTRDVTETLRERKADILAFLGANADAAPEEGRSIRARGDMAPPLSFAQQRLWFIDQMLPDAALYHMTFAIEASGALDLQALEKAMRGGVRRHAVLRTRIGAEGGEPRQVVVEDDGLPIDYIDRRHNPPGEQELNALIRLDARRVFDLSSQPPLRLTVLALAADRYVLLLTLHHIAADGWSTDVLLRDLAALYLQAVSGAAALLPPLPVQYGDFAAWQRHYLQGERLERALSFWREALGGPLPVTQFPTDFQRPSVQNNEGGLFGFDVDAATAERLRGLAAAEGATLFATLFTAFNILVYRYTGQTDLVIGTPVANRRQGETEELVGLFVNPLPIRSKLRPAAGFSENLRAVQAALWSAIEHQDLPFERLVEELQPDRDLSMNPLFQLRFQLDPAPRGQVGLPGLHLRRLPRQDGISRLDLGLDLREDGDCIRGSFEYDTALFHLETVCALAGHFINLLRAIAAEPARPLASLSLLSQEERQRQLIDWNDTDTPCRPVCFQQLFEARAADTPDAVALIHDEGGDVRRQTYGELNRRANQLAHLLRRRGVGPETVTGIALDRGFDMVAAWLAVLKAGGAYLPLDPTYPPERLAYMLADSGAGLVLTSRSMELPAGVGRLDLDAAWPVGEPVSDPDCVSRPEHLAYVIYTSGSTGRPKGVLVEHGGLANLTGDKIRVCDVRPGDCVLQFFSLSFDASIPELVMSLGAGASLLLLPASEVLPGPGLAQRLRSHGVTHVTMTPSALLSLPEGEYPSLRMVLAGGEAPSRELIERWGRSRLFINAYGPTETTVNASMVPCGNGHPAEATLRPAANKQLYVLDANMEPLPVGVPGELHIGGVGIARGYHGRPALTAERFVPDPFGAGRVLYRTGDRACQLADGRIRVLGRLDDQVKIRGYRIEPGEIEAAVLAHREVASATVAIKEWRPGEKRIVAYAVAKSAVRPEAAEMRAWLSQRLLRFLLPDAFVWLDALPLTVNGKVNVAALPMPDFGGDRAGRAPAGATEEKLAEIFSAVLGRPQVTANDDFFDIGGHSLMATRLSAMARERFSLDVSVLDIFTAPTVEALAVRIEARVSNAAPFAAAGTEEYSLRNDILLDPAIRPPAEVRSIYPPRSVLLTGATGFLGAYLLWALLQDPRREVWCLVRGEAGIARLRKALARYGLWEDRMAQRLRVVTGDLARPDLGLDAKTCASLAGGMDAIFHNAAEVHHLLPYERLRATNVDGTREILRLACAGAGRPLHHVSTLSALTPPVDRRPVRESDGIAGFAPPAGGYNRSKWVAEHLVDAARKRGLPVTIHRPGAVSGDSRTGAFNSADILCRLMQGYLRSGMAPEGDTLLDMLPVDYVSRAIVHLADNAASAGRNFHLVHSSPVSSASLFDACAAQGLDVRRVSRSVWQDMLGQIARSEPDHPLYPLMGLFEGGGRGRGGGAMPGQRSFECGSTHEALADAPFAEPALDASLFARYLRAFVETGALQPPIANEQDHD